MDDVRLALFGALNAIRDALFQPRKLRLGAGQTLHWQAPAQQALHCLRDAGAERATHLCRQRMRPDIRQRQDGHLPINEVWIAAAGR